MATLELRNVNKSYGSGLADTLKNIELSIDSGEFLILVGPSGCGKSTLMNCIAGLEGISGGAIMVDGQDISGMSPKDRDIAMVFQSYALYPTMSVRENIAFGLKIRKLPQAEIDVVASTNQATRRSDCLRLGRGLWRAHAGTIDPDGETVEPALRVDDRNERLRRHRRRASSCKRKKGGEIEDHWPPPSRRSKRSSIRRR